MPEPAIVDALTSLGFDLNDARAYHALLKHGTSTGYEVAQRAAIPRSAVSSALRKLVDEGAARAIQGTPERFVATPADQVLAKLKQGFDASAERLRAEAAKLDVAPEAPDAFSLRGYERILEEAARMIHGAERTLVIAGWPRELARLSGELAAAAARDVYTVLFSHAVLPETVAGRHFSYGLAETDLERFWKHRLVVVADDVRCMIGATEGLSGDTAVVSEARAIAELAVSQVALDVTLLAARYDADVSRMMARILGDRVGRLDALLSSEPVPRLGERLGPAPTRGRKA